MNLKPLPFNRLKTTPLAKRRTDAEDADFGSPFLAGGAFGDFLCSLPGIGAARDLVELRDAIVSAHRRGRGMLLACGGHVMDAGLSPLIVRMMEERIITGVALTGAALLQDVEIALSGHTLTSYERDAEGDYRVTEETTGLINEAVNFGAIEGWGIGRSVGEKLMDKEPEHLDRSVVATAARHSIPLTVHPAIGADAFNLHPATHGESLGAAGLMDFRLLAAMLAAVRDGVVMVAASTMLSRVLIQAADAARNLGRGVENLTCALVDPAASATAVADMADRLSQPGGRGIWLPAPDELALPLLFAAVQDAMSDLHE